MDNYDKIQQLQYAINTLYYVMGMPGCNTREIQNELYPAIHSIERVIIQLEQQEDEERTC